MIISCNFSSSFPYMFRFDCLLQLIAVIILVNIFNSILADTAENTQNNVTNVVIDNDPSTTTSPQLPNIEDIHFDESENNTTISEDDVKDDDKSTVKRTINYHANKFNGPIIVSEDRLFAPADEYTGKQINVQIIEPHNNGQYLKETVFQRQENSTVVTSTTTTTERANRRKIGVQKSISSKFLAPIQAGLRLSNDAKNKSDDDCDDEDISEQTNLSQERERKKQERTFIEIQKNTKIKKVTTVEPPRHHNVIGSRFTTSTQSPCEQSLPCSTDRNLRPSSTPRLHTINPSTLRSHSFSPPRPNLHVSSNSQSIHKSHTSQPPIYIHTHTEVPVEKIVDRPVPYPVEKIVNQLVKVPYPVEIEKLVVKEVKIPVDRVVEKHINHQIHIPIERPYPVEKVVEKLVHVPYPVQKIVNRPVEVEKIVTKEVQVPVDRFVEKIVDRPVEVERIVEKHVQVPVDRIVERIVDRPVEVERIVEKQIQVPVDRVVEKFIDRPFEVEKIVEKEVHVPYDRVIEKIVDRPVEVPVEKIVEKPVPYLVEKLVEKYIDRPVPVEVGVPVHVPYLFQVEVPVHSAVPYPVHVPVPYLLKPPPKPQQYLIKTTKYTKGHHGLFNLKHNHQKNVKHVFIKQPNYIPDEILHQSTDIDSIGLIPPPRQVFQHSIYF